MFFPTRAIRWRNTNAYAEKGMLGSHAHLGFVDTPADTTPIVLTRIIPVTTKILRARNPTHIY